MGSENQRVLQKWLANRDWRIVHDTQRYGETAGFRKYGRFVDFEGSLDEAEDKAYAMSWELDAGLDGQYYVDRADVIRDLQSQVNFEARGPRRAG